ncbi:enoyl-CoA hydratase/isomerase family protein [Actinoallomurus bryophytorum]|uniref:Enoyl-CoA hydratase n=1 Tax=Actinoallomurus bryophytorum TaxID=1490222 RepID=A0A543CMY9_9ACTN|nr:enoyl-CoA hydratase/isomerase family protein [Actinoallomurus bryophytorum]TQL98462.1 enoyl-CoA hydratase [Actinoallomurus bryophytorum]
MIEVDVVNGVGYVRLAHGKVNALDLELCQAIEETMRRLDIEDVRAVVLTGAGRAFSAGVDLHRIVAGGTGYVAEYLPALVGAFRAVFDLGKPVVAAVNGHAIAGGCVLAAACDHRIMATGNGTIGVPELYVGVPFPAAALEIMRFALGPAGARRAILNGTNHPPAEALSHGLVDELAAPADLLDRARSVADRLSTAIPADTFRHTKKQWHAEVTGRIDALADASETTTLDLWKTRATDGRIQSFMDRTVRARQDP